MKKSSIYGILSIVLIVGMFFTGCASKNNASQLNTNVSNLPIHQMHASFVYDTDNIREAVGICDYVFVAKVVSCDGTEYRNVITTEDEKGNPIKIYDTKEDLDSYKKYFLSKNYIQFEDFTILADLYFK